MVRTAVLPLLCICGGAAAFLLPLQPSHVAVGQRSYSSLSKVHSAVQEPPVAAMAPIAGAPEEGFDINDHFDEEPVDPTPEELAQLTKEEMEAVLPGDGRTVRQWLEQDSPTFRDGSSVMDWVLEAQRLRQLPFIERAEHLKALSFEDINQFRFRSREWGQMLVEKGFLPPAEGMEEEGVTEMPDGEYRAKLEANRAKYKSAAEMEAALLQQMDAKLLAARFEGTAMDGKVKVVLDGRMQPISCEVSQAALAGNPDGASISAAVETAVEMAFKQSAEFYEATLAEDYLAKAQSPTDVEGIFEAFGNKEFEVVADVVDPHMLEE